MGKTYTLEDNDGLMAELRSMHGKMALAAMAVLLFCVCGTEDAEGVAQPLSCGGECVKTQPFSEKS